MRSVAFIVVASLVIVAVAVSHCSYYRCARNVGGPIVHDANPGLDEVLDKVLLKSTELRDLHRHFEVQKIKWTDEIVLLRQELARFKQQKLTHVKITSQNKCDIKLSLQAFYGEKANLPDFPMFKGGYINFGYWGAYSDIASLSLTPEVRAGASRALYEFVMAHLPPLDARSAVVELGSGTGAGACFLMMSGATKYVGVDASAAQVARARQSWKECPLQHKLSVPSVRFVHTKAENTELESGSATHIVSVEAAQHFSELSLVLHEAHRVLAPGGTLGLTTFFGTTIDAEQRAATIPTVVSGVDKLWPLVHAREAFAAAGFVDVHEVRFGRDVFPALDTWLEAQPRLEQTWNRNWLELFESGVVEYTLLLGRKPTSSDLDLAHATRWYTNIWNPERLKFT